MRHSLPSAASGHLDWTAEWRKPQLPPFAFVQLEKLAGGPCGDGYTLLRIW